MEETSSLPPQPIAPTPVETPAPAADELPFASTPSLVETAPTLSSDEQDAIQPADIAEAPAAEPVEKISSPPAVPSTAVEETAIQPAEIAEAPAAEPVEEILSPPAVPPTAVEEISSPPPAVPSAVEETAIQPAEIAEAPAAEPVEEISSPPAVLPPTAVEEISSPPPETATHRFPMRFVWQMDAATRFTLDSEEFVQLIGPTAAALLGRPWTEIADALALDSAGHVARALAARETFSGIVVPWPACDTGDRLPVEMSGLPAFDRDRQFEGFRGVGVCRDFDRIAALTQQLDQQPTPPTPVETSAPAANELLFASTPSLVETTPTLSQAPATETVEEISSPPPIVPSTAVEEISSPPPAVPPTAVEETSSLPPQPIAPTPVETPAPAANELPFASTPSLMETAPTLSPGEQNTIQPAEIAEAPATETVEEISSPPAVPSTVVEETSPPPPAVPSTAPESATPRFPIRFVWQMDAATRFTVDSEEFVQLIGPTAAALLGRPWTEIADALALDSAGHVARALAARETFSGIVVPWPAGDTGDRLPVEMSGLPAFDHDRQFEGFRGVGVCRDFDRIAALNQQLDQQPTPPTPVETPAPAANELPFASTPSLVETAPTLSPSEQNAFQEIARELSDRLTKTAGQDASPEGEHELGPERVAAGAMPAPPKPAGYDNVARETQESRPILDRLPTGILIYRVNSLIYANRAFLDWTGYTSLDALTEAGGLHSLFIENTAGPAEPGDNGGRTLTIATPKGRQMPVEGRLFSVPWNGEPALALMIHTATDGKPNAEQALHRLEVENRELKAVLDTATDGVLMLNRAGRVLSANRSAEALFGYNADELEVLVFADLFAPESRRAAYDYLDRAARASSPMLINEGTEVIGLVRQGGLVPLFMTMGRIENGEKLCVIFRDITAWKRTEEELINARLQAEQVSAAKSEFLAKTSHEIRTPLNAIIGFSEVMMNERFGPVGNERYRQYLRDIHASGGHLISLVNDLLDLSKIESGKLNLTFVNVNLNELVRQCVAILQQQANHERVIIRTSLATLPPIVADARSVRQIALNLLSNSIKFTGAGGQVIVSTALTDNDDVVLRVRNTGAGMSEKELEIAFEPFRQIPTSSRGSGLGLPICKALAEANHARFSITSQVASGTLAEVVFPATKLAREFGDRT